MDVPETDFEAHDYPCKKQWERVKKCKEAVVQARAAEIVEVPSSLAAGQENPVINPGGKWIDTLNAREALKQACKELAKCHADKDLPPPECLDSTEGE